MSYNLLHVVTCECRGGVLIRYILHTCSILYNVYIVPSIVLIQLYSEMRRNSTIIQILSTMNNTSWDVFTLQNSKVLATY